MYEQHRHNNEKNYYEKAPINVAMDERVLGLAFCNSVSCQGIFSNSTMLKANRKFHLRFSIFNVFFTTIIFLALSLSLLGCQVLGY